MTEYTVTLTQLIKELNLGVAYVPKPTDELLVRSPEVNRPAIVLGGFSKHFDKNRLQACGMVEMSYLSELSPEERLKSCENLFSLEPVAVIVTRSLEIFDEMLLLAKKYSVPLLTSSEKSSMLMSQAIAYLSVELAPRIFRHGVLIEVYGEGVLILGESGIGKSETAVELLKRGHRLIADDSVELRKVSTHTIVGRAPENIKHFIEVRGIGIINVRSLFGMGAIKETERIDIVVELEQLVAGKNYSTIEAESEKISILGVDIPKLTVPVRPGRNLAVIVEVAAMNHRQIKMGFNPIDELYANLNIPKD